MPYFGVPIRNGLPIGLGTLTALAQAVAVVVPPVSSDPYFEYVSLLANTTSTNGAQNNTFLDSSTNAFSITRNGNTTQGNFSPFSQTGWSNYFDGTGDYLTVPDNAAFTLGSGNFTVEAWIFNGTTGARKMIGGQGDAGGLQSSISVYMEKSAANKLSAGICSGSTQYTAVSTADLPLNQWVHVAFVRNGNTGTVYINGTADGTVNLTGITANDSANLFAVGALGQLTTLTFEGYISNFRLVVGTAVYTGAFTPPTAPLTAITNTAFLTCQSNRFIDNSSNAFAITRNGDVSVQAFSPFNPTAAWSASTNGGSGYFDGTGDYLSLADNAALQMASGDFTIEFWWNPASIANFQTVLEKGYTAAGGLLLQTGSGNGTIVVYAAGTTVITASSGSSVGAWDHYALVRSGTTMTLYRNGASVGSATNSTNFNSTASLFVGGSTGGGGYYVNGYLSNVRIVKGTAVYTAAFTPPTTPLTAITNTSLLLNFTNAGIYDSASGNDLETVGNAQVSTTQAKWGTTSMAFDGTGDWLTALDRPALRFGTGDFTVEMWIYITGGLPPGGIIGKGTSTTGWELSWQTGNTLRFTFGSTATTSVATFNNNTWYHVALVRSGSAVGNVKLYLDGTAIITSGTAVTDNLNQTNTLYVGADRTGLNAYQGYIDDLRITNGYARYTANFTPPTAAFPTL